MSVPVQIFHPRLPLSGAENASNIEPGGTSLFRRPRCGSAGRTDFRVCELVRLHPLPDATGCHHFPGNWAWEDADRVGREGTKSERLSRRLVRADPVETLFQAI